VQFAVTQTAEVDGHIHFLPSIEVESCFSISFDRCEGVCFATLV